MPYLHEVGYTALAARSALEIGAAILPQRIAGSV